jgi:hypothetical protein
MEAKLGGGAPASEDPARQAPRLRERNTGRRDSYTWRPLWWSVAGACVSAFWIHYMRFAPVTAQSVASSVLKFTVGVALWLGTPAFLGYALFLPLRMMVALARLRFRRALSLACAIAVIPLVFVGLVRLIIFDPWYWYVLLNQSRFATEARAASSSGPPAFAILEDRDVSVGLATNPPLFAAVVYDESDELGLPTTQRSPAWEARNGKRLLADNNLVVGVRHLLGHFYLVNRTYP